MCHQRGLKVLSKWICVTLDNCWLTCNKKGGVVCFAIAHGKMSESIAFDSHYGWAAIILCHSKPLYKLFLSPFSLRGSPNWIISCNVVNKSSTQASLRYITTHLQDVIGITSSGKSKHFLPVFLEVDVLFLVSPRTEPSESMQPWQQMVSYIMSLETFEDKNRFEFWVSGVAFLVVVSK